MLEKNLFSEESKITLANGADLYCLNTDEYKRSCLDIFFTFPADEYRSPLIRLLLSVLFRGSKSFPTLTEMNRLLDSMYDSTVYWKDYHLGANHTYRISCSTLDKKYIPKKDSGLDLLGETLKLVGDVLLNPLLDEDGLLSKSFFDSEVDFAIDNIRSKLNTPKTYAGIKCNQMLFGNDPAGISLDGTEELLRGYTRKELTEIRKYFLTRSTITAYYVGTDSACGIANKLAPLFERIGERAPESIIPKYAVSHTEYKEAEEEFNLTQGILRIGLTCDSVAGDSDNAAMSLYNEILGGSSTSKLFMNVRERKSLCYYCSSGIDNCCGIIMIACGIKPENKDMALGEIKKQINEMSIGSISEEEIDAAKKGLINSLNQISDSSSSVIVSSFKYKLLTGTDISADERKEQIMRLTKDDIVRFAGKVRISAVFFLTSKDGMSNNDLDDAEQEDEEYE